MTVLVASAARGVLFRGIFPIIRLPDHGGLGLGLGEQIKGVVPGTPVFDVGPIEGFLTLNTHDRHRIVEILAPSRSFAPAKLLNDDVFGGWQPGLPFPKE